MIVEANVPLKLTLFGEHAVVYGKPAIAYTISENLKVRVRESEKFYVASDNLQLKGIRVDLHEFKIENENVKKVISYVTEVINYFSEKYGFNNERKALIEIESNVDPSVGLGTSAAVVVGTVIAYSKFLGLDLQKQDIAKISHEIELRVQGIASIMDTHTETYGGFLLIRENKVENLNIPVPLTFSAGYFRRIMTTAEMLRNVKNLKDRDPSLFNSLIDSIERVTLEAKEALISGDIDRLGELMYVNHGLLFSLGVTVPILDQFVSMSRASGVKGCKVSGGGGGGAVICTKDQRAELLMNALGGRIVNANPTFQGVTVKLI
ncbi:mevalonate kinase [Stygiolobus caldivivus]|uniref:Mevalonate kinase n=1 Tax=Stygiolobus caldivivus TaxID=2824673 RepID=A0A8D5U4U6_9CREN|nr:mevalonate kinase [Stygiolobus caldivivus]BCU69304.1 mevalonate kinase [Stygiolobus caldivivus]